MAMSIKSKEEQSPRKNTTHLAADKNKLLRQKLLEMIKKNESLRQAKPR
jgi:hypothetical protein